ASRADAGVDASPVLRDGSEDRIHGFLFARDLAVHAGPEEVLAAAHPGDDGPVRRPGGADQGLCSGTVHLHNLLATGPDRPCASSAFRRSTTTVRPRSSKTDASSLLRRRSVSPGRSTTPAFRI